MLTALLEGKKILATDPAWDDHKEELRKLCKNKAVCPICKEPVLCRFGDRNIHHFAHSRLSDCPGNHDTEEHMKGKAFLYTFFKKRYEKKADIEVECTLPGMSTPSDIVVHFNNGDPWAIEYFCDNMKESDLRKKNRYYKDNNILVNWLITHDRFQKVNAFDIKVKLLDKILIKATWADKYYSSDWHEKIVRKRIVSPLPKDSSSLGTLCYLDVNTGQIKIVRALKETDHVTYLIPGAILEGPMKEVIISKSNVWYFDYEKDWAHKYEEAQKILEELEIEARKKEKAPKENLKDQGINILQKLQRGAFSKPIFCESEEDKNWREQWVLRQKQIYKCKVCGGEFPQSDMVDYFLAKREGVCRDCSRKCSS